MGYLHHARYFEYFEVGRTELLRQSGIRYRDMEERGLFYVVAKIECRFRAPIRYDDVVTLDTSIERFSPVRVDHRYVLRRGDEVCTEAGSVLVLIGPDRRPTALPDELYEILAGEPRPGR